MQIDLPMTIMTHQAKRPSLLLAALETRAVYELWAYYVSLPFLQAAPRGDGHPVMVLPGFMASDLSTLPLRLYLKSRGYNAYGWGMGRNYGRGIDPQNGIPPNAKTIKRIKAMYRKHGQKVSLVGWSLGGIYARELARLLPEYVRTVITLGSPFTNDERANNVYPLFERMSGHRLEDINPEVRRRLKEHVPVPSTAVYSKSDGVVSWRCCLEQLDEYSENVEVFSSHTGLGHNPLVLWVVADRLAQPEGEWRPFERSGLKKWLYQQEEQDTC
ncbi:MAG: alpha/beta hydrolase [Chloroflexota bacterium]